MLFFKYKVTLFQNTIIERLYLAVKREKELGFEMPISDHLGEKLV